MKKTLLFNAKEQEVPTLTILQETVANLGNNVSVYITMRYSSYRFDIITELDIPIKFEITADLLGFDIQLSGRRPTLLELEKINLTTTESTVLVEARIQDTSKFALYRFGFSPEHSGGGGAN